MDLIKVELSYEGNVYVTELTPTQIEIISSDSEKYLDLINTLRDQYASASQVTVVTQPQKECEILKEVESKWTDQNIKAMLRLRFDMEGAFNKPSQKKSKLWQTIAARLNAEVNTNFSGENCNVKFRNLLQTYKYNKQKRHKSTGESSITWDYYDIFDEIMGHKAAVMTPKEILSKSLLDTDEVIVNSESNCNFTSEVAESTETNCTVDKEKTDQTAQKDKIKKKKEKEDMSLGTYLFLKHKKEEEKIAMKNKKWEDERQLKILEIEAVNNLAKAIALSRKTGEKRRKSSSESD